MGISVGELLSLEFFKDFQIIAGKKGLNLEIQGVTFMEAPDAFRWAIGKELVFTSGYVFSKEDGFVEKFTSTFSQGHAALVIKRERYLDVIPEELIEIYEKNNVPLITMPYSLPWMEVINQVNVAVMNHAIQRLCVNTSTRFNGHTQNYQVQRIQSILRIVENEMEFPAFLYDVFLEKSYYSSPNFQKVSKKYGLKDEDYWSPEIPHTSHTLCDCIHMKRYRLLKEEALNEPRISWVVIPIQARGITQAYFCVMESRKFMDFYDEYSMRIAYLMLQGIYEQFVVARDASNIGFENLIHLALESSEGDNRRLVYQAGQYGLSMEQPYIYILFCHNHKTYDIRNKRNEMLELFHQCSMDRSGQMAFLSKNEGLILLNPNSMKTMDKTVLRDFIREYQEKLKRKFEGIDWDFSLCNEQKSLAGIKASVEKCRKVVKIGRVAEPEKTIHDYDELGILTWLDIPEGEFKQIFEKFHDLTEAGKSRELLHTLKIYLENNMNYSLTAEKLFVNVNTIRRRIEKVNELFDIDWDNYFERTKIGLMLQFFAAE